MAENESIRQASYSGRFSVELCDKAGTKNIPSNSNLIKLNGRLVQIENGQYWPTDPGFMIKADGRTFGWGFGYIKCIRDGTGEIIWHNNRFKRELSI